MPSETYTVGFSKLGKTTQIYDRNVKACGFELWVWVSFGCPEDRKQAISASFALVRPAHTTFRIRWFDHYVALTTTEQFSSGSWDPSYYHIGSGSIVGVGSTLGMGLMPSGSEYVSPVMDLGSDYNTFHWSYDWVYEGRRNAYCDMWVRSGDTLDLSSASWESGSVGLVIPSGSVKRFHQFKFRGYFSGSGDFRFHQFTLRGFRVPLYEL